MVLYDSAYIDSELNVNVNSSIQDGKDNDIVGKIGKHRRKYQKISNTEASKLIGGTNVKSNARKANNEEEEGELLEDLLDEDEVVREDREDNGDTYEAESLVSYDGSYETRESDSDDEELAPYPSHKIFTFQLPLGGSTQLSPMNKLKSILSYPVSDISHDRKLHIKKEEIKQKLKRQDSISTIEEQILFKNTKGIDNVRKLAIKETFQMDSLKSTIRSITKDVQKFAGDDKVVLVDRKETIYNELEGDLVIMGGYRGSILRDAETGRTVWIPMKTALNLRDVDLLIGPEPDDELKAEKQIKPDGMLKNVGPIDISRKLIRKLRKSGKLNVEEFGYDWRLSLDIPAGHLIKKLEKLYDKQKVKKGTYIIAHSMGGMIAHKVLQSHTHLVRGIIYVGCPSQCPNILGPIRFGDEVMFNKKVLSPETNFFMRSSFTFLPIDGRCFVDKKQKKRYDLDFFDPDVWVKLGLSPVVSEKRINSTAELKPTDSFTSLVSLNTYISGSQKIIQSFNPLHFIKTVTSTEDLQEEIQVEEYDFKNSYEESYNYLKRTLEATKLFLESLKYIEGKKYPPLAIVYGNEVPTVRGAKVDGLEDIRDGHYFSFYYGPGDGVVHHKWLLPERRGFPVVAKIASPLGHVSLMTDFNAIGNAFIALVDNEKKP